MYANNLANLVEHFWNKETNGMVLKREDEILKGCLVTHGGEVVNERLRQAILVKG
jgi:H+-translocating NAD(P) transhydrogenase subunit alpha